MKVVTKTDRKDSSWHVGDLIANDADDGDVYLVVKSLDLDLDSEDNFALISLKSNGIMGQRHSLALLKHSFEDNGDRFVKGHFVED